MQTNEFSTITRAVAAIDHHLTRNTRHFRNRQGRLLTTLDQVIQAILTNDLAPFPARKEVRYGQTAQRRPAVPPAPAQNMRQL